MCQPDKHGAPLKREINWKKAGQILLSFTPLGWAPWIWLPRRFGKLQPSRSTDSFARLLWTECKCRSWAGGAMPDGCCAACSATDVGAALQRVYTGSRFLSQTSSSGWLKILILKLLLSHQSHTVQFRMAIFFIVKGGKYFFILNKKQEKELSSKILSRD